eukprot:1081176-Prymnesium_polylepis.2
MPNQCDDCPLGSACPPGTSTPLLCAAGRYGAAVRQRTRECNGPCSLGHYCEEGSTSSTSGICRVCRYTRAAPQPDSPPAGTFNPRIASVNEQACQRCEVGRFSANGSAECTQCADGYFRVHAEAIASDCQPCDAIPGISCRSDATTATVHLLEQFWRHSNVTLQVWRCMSLGDWSPCSGGVEAGHDGDGYCNNATDGGYMGPRCEGRTAMIRTG